MIFKEAIPIVSRVRDWWTGGPPPLPTELPATPANGSLFWGGQYIDDRFFAPHFAIVGTTRSGKTLTLRMLLRHALLDANGRLKSRAVIYDPQSELGPVLQAMGICSEQIYDLNPFHEGSYRWEIARDLVEPAQIEQFAEITFPDEKSSSENAFFRKAARGLLAGVLTAFLWSGRKDFQLFHVAAAMSQKSTLRRILLSSPEAAFKVAQYLETGRTWKDIRATLETEIAPYRGLGHLWRTSRHSISLDEWAQRAEPSILLLSTREVAKKALQTVNRLIFKRITEVLLDRPPGRRRGDTWLFLEEMADAGRLLGLYSTMTRGASKGVRIVLAFQELKGLREVYGPNEAESILSQCGNRAIFRVTDASTAQWASQNLGKYEYCKCSYTEGTSQGEGRSEQYSQSTQWSLDERFHVPHYKLLELPLASPETGLQGYFTCTGAAAPWLASIPPNVVAELAALDAPQVPERRLRDPAEQWTPKLDATDRAILLLDGSAPARADRGKSRSIRIPGEAADRLYDFFGDDEEDELEGDDDET